MSEYRPILLVEDSPKDLELTLEALERCNIVNRIDIARDGEEALDYLFRRGTFEGRNEGDPTVVLLDLKLPKIDGLEVLQKIKSDQRLQRVPVVMLTSSREEQDLVASYELGVNAFVVKPVEFSHFMEAISNLGVFWALLNEPAPMGEHRWT